METIEEHPCSNSLPEVVKAEVSIGDMAVESVTPQVCQKSNGVVEAVTPDSNTTEETLPVLQDVKSVVNESSLANNVESVAVASLQPENIKEDAAEIGQLQKDNVVEPDRTDNISVGTLDCDNTGELSVTEDIMESQTFTCPEADLGDLQESSNIEEKNNSKNVSFETEILVEENIDLNEPTEVTQNDTHMLNELNESMELSDVLNSSDVSGNVENNNSSMKQEVFNKEELLDILQGKNDDDIVPHNINKDIETQIALRQLSRLKRENKSKPSPKNTRNKRLNKDITPIKKQKDTPKKLTQKQDIEKNKLVEKFDTEQKEVVEKHPEIDEKDGDSNSIVDVLVKDWEDDEPDGQKPNDNMETTKPEITQPGETKSEESDKTTLHDSTSENQIVDLNKSGDECHTRRLGRVIKKKVIFDPDNPDTFTKGKTATKSKELIEPPVKSRKVDNATSPRAKSKSPVGKGQWKKPTPKGNKHCKRLTEVDKLLMDEGIVNMMYQLTPEVSKGKKTMRTKAEIIKKLQSSNPERNEMKFRERKKEEAKKILGSKLRTSMSSSVKSVGEDFETHSADDSIIYRRHSSSSYSSSCMSPRRMSDVETNATQSVQATPEATTPNPNKSNLQLADVFVPETPKPEVINKEDCLSLKQKLNSKLSQALNKRKRESAKTDKPIKQIKVKDESTKSKMLDYIGFKFLNVKFDQKLAEINITQITSKNTVPILRELELAISYVDKKSDVSVTYLTSACGTLINPVLNLQPLLDNNIETRTNSAHELAEAVRLLLCTMKQHSKLLVSSVWGECGGLSLALLGLCDVVVASEQATFALQPPPRRAATAPLHPGVAVFTAGYRRLPQSLVNDLVLFGRRLSAAEAAAGGLVSRVVWPERCQEQARALVKDIAAQPAKTIQLKKRLLCLKNHCDSENTFLSCLEAERDMFVEYWTSVEGQELLRAYLIPV